MNVLGNGLYEVQRYEEELSIIEAGLACDMRLGVPEEKILVTKANLAMCYKSLQRYGEAFRLIRDVYKRSRALHGAQSPEALDDAVNLANVLIVTERFGKARRFVCKRILEAQLALGSEHELTLLLRRQFARSLYMPENASRADCWQAEKILEGDVEVVRRLFGPDHPHTKIWVSSLNKVRKRIMDRGPPSKRPTFLEIARIVLAAREPLEQCRLNKNS